MKIAGEHTPRILAMCLVKNESDIIRQCLTAASEWCDAIYVFDNGSQDGTWEQVLEFAGKNRAIVPYKQDLRPFRDSLRGEIFEHYRGNSKEGDWWCRLDADEFYIDNPRIFLSVVPLEYDLIWSASFQYYFTEKDLVRYRGNPDLFGDNVPVEKKCRYFLNNWSEPRFFRFTKELDCKDRGWPRPLRQSYPKRIRLKHFQYRSPEQIQKRLSTRKEAMASGIFGHEKVPNWRARLGREKSMSAGQVDGYFPASWEERIADSSTLSFDDGNTNYEIREAALLPIRNPAEFAIGLREKLARL
jgi:glycosyltransferase involved in cell wall biosynthesis